MTRYTFAYPKPFAHQRRGVQRIVEAGGRMALLCDPGTGKSRMVIDYLGLLAVNFAEPVRVVIVSPKSVQDSWIAEFAKWLGPDVGYYIEVLQGSIPEKMARLGDGIVPGPANTGICDGRDGTAGMILVSVLNYEVLSSRRTSKGPRGGAVSHVSLISKAIDKWKPDILICDESHRLKSATSNAGRMAARIATKIPRRVLLTGTPMPHSPLDVWSQWNIMVPEAFSTCGEPWRFPQFRDEYAILDHFDHPIGFKRLDDMQARMSPNSYVVHKEDCLDLPPVTYVDVPFDLNPQEKQAYRSMKRDMQVLLSDNSEMNAGLAITQRLRLRQVTCGIVTTDENELVQIGSSRLDRCVDLLEDVMAGENRCVIFAWSRWECDKLAERLRNSPVHGAEVRLITGATSEADKLRYRTEFGSNSTKKLILIAQIRTISLGVNELVSACYGIFLSLSEDRSDLEQAIARLDRQGQTRPVTLYFFVARGTIDSVILQSHRDRTDLETAVLNHLKEA